MATLKDAINTKINNTNMFKRIFIASFLCGIVTGIVCCLLWLLISGVNWFGFSPIIITFIANGCLAGLISYLLYVKCRLKSLSLSLYLGNTIPLCVCLLIIFFQADASTEAWPLLFLFGWLLLSVIPAIITRVLLQRSLVKGQNHAD